MYYYEVSAKTGKNVNDVFQKLCNEINYIAKQSIDMRIDSGKQMSVLDEAIDRRGPGKKLKKKESPASKLKKGCC